MGPVILPVTLVTSGGAALIAFWLAMRTGSARRGAKVSIGDGGNPLLVARMRAQANFTEYVPYILILIGLIELSCGAPTWLWVAGGLLLIGRILHALGMDGVRHGRVVGIAITFLLLVGLGGYAIVLPFLASAPTHAVKMQVLPAQG